MSLHTETVKVPKNGSLADVGADSRFYIIWNPKGTTPPQVTFTTHRHATKQAAMMAEKHGGDFFVCRADARLRRNVKGVVRYTHLPKRKEDQYPMTNTFESQIQNLKDILKTKGNFVMVDIGVSMQWNPVIDRAEFLLTARANTGTVETNMGTVIRDTWQKCYDAAYHLFSGNPVLAQDETSAIESATYRGLATALGVQKTSPAQGLVGDEAPPENSAAEDAAKTSVAD